MTTTIALLNMKGGVGKTTLAVNIGWYLHKTEEADVLLVDLDPQFNSTQYVMDYKKFQSHRKTAGTIADLLMNQPALDLKPKKKGKLKTSSAIYNVSTSDGSRFDLLPAELRLAWVVKNPAQTEYKLEKLLQEVRDGYDYVLIDCAPTDTVLTTMALMASDYLLIPMKPDRFSILGFVNLMETIENFRGNCNDPHNAKVLGVVFTQVSSDSPLEQQAIAEVKIEADKEKISLFNSVLGHSRSFTRSVADQTPIFETAWAKKTTRNAIGKIVDEMKKRIAALAAAGKATKK